MGKQGDGSTFREHMAEIPEEKKFVLHCAMSAGAIVPQGDLPYPDDPNVTGGVLPMVMIEGELARIDGEETLGKVLVSITLKDAVVLRRTIDRLESALDATKQHERN